MSRVAIFLADIIADIKGIDRSIIASNTNLRSLQLDSLDVLEIVMALEENFDVDLDPARLGACENLIDIAGLVEAAKSTK